MGCGLVGGWRHQGAGTVRSFKRSHIVSIPSVVLSLLLSTYLVAGSVFIISEAVENKSTVDY